MAFDDLSISQFNLLLKIYEAYKSGKYNSEFDTPYDEEKGWTIHLHGISGNEDQELRGFTEGDLIGLETNRYLTTIPKSAGYALSLSEKALEQFYLSQAIRRERDGSQEIDRMSFNGLTPIQQKVITRLIEEMKTGQFSSEFFALSSMGKGWGIQLFKKGESGGIELTGIDDLEETDLHSLQAEGYITLISKDGDYAGSLKQKAYREYERHQEVANGVHDKMNKAKSELIKFLNELAKTRGRAVRRAEGRELDALRDFQEEVDILKALEEQGYVEIIGEPHRESSTRYRFIDLIQIELTGKGSRWFSDHQDFPLLPQPEVHMNNQNIASPSDPRKVFVVHGRNARARDSLFAFLRTIGLTPIEWSQAVKLTKNPSPYIGEVLDTAFAEAQAIVVLMTPDDEARLREPFRTPTDGQHERELTPQARPNVLFEAGMAMGRSPKRTVLVEIGELRPFSDIGGRHVIKLNNSSQARHDLADRLEMAGCQVDLSGRDWHSVGNFDLDS